MEDFISQVPAQALFEFLKMSEINSLMRTCKILQNDVNLNFYKNSRIMKIQNEIRNEYYNFQPKIHNYNKLIRSRKIIRTKNIHTIETCLYGSYVIYETVEGYSEFSEMLSKCEVY